MELIADGLLIATALTAALYCVILSRRLRRLTDAEAGIGTQIRALNKALEETRAALTETRRGVAEARGSARSATDALAREVSGAREVLTALERAQELARARTEGLGELSHSNLGPGNGVVGSPEMPAGPASAVAQVVTEAAEPASELDDEIPDWPDGVVPAPSGIEETSAGELAGVAGGPPGAGDGSGGLLRVERMAL